MRQQWEHRKQGIFVAEGEKVVRRLLESDFNLISLLLPHRWAQEYEPLLQKRPEPDIPVYVADKELLEKLIGFSMYQGVMAVAKVPEPATLDSVLKSTPKPHLFVALDGVSNAENLGVVLRGCAAFGAQALFSGETCASPFLRRAVRNSMGAIFKIPVVETPNLVECLGAMKQHGIRVVAAHPHAEGRFFSGTDLKGDCCLVLGSEGEGISIEVLDVCDEAASVPMQNDVDSLNVASAAVVFLYEAVRQRGQC